MTNNLTPEETLDIIKKEFSHVDFDNRSRRKEYVLLRQMYGYFARLNPSFSQSYVGSKLAMKANHATIIHGVKTISDYVTTKDKEVMPIYLRLEEAIKDAQKGLKRDLVSEYKYHHSKAMALKAKIEAQDNKHKELKETVKQAQTKELKEQSKQVLNKIISKSKYDVYLLNSLNKWLETKQSTDLLECTKAIGFNHKENFNTFKNLQQSII